MGCLLVQSLKLSKNRKLWINCATKQRWSLIWMWFSVFTGPETVLIKYSFWLYYFCSSYARSIVYFSLLLVSFRSPFSSLPHNFICILPVFDRLRSQSTAKIRVCTPTSCILSYQMKVNKLIRESAISARLLWDQPAWCLIGIRQKTKTSTTSADTPNNYCLGKGGMLRSSALVLFPGRRKSNPFWSLLKDRFVGP